MSDTVEALKTIYDFLLIWRSIATTIGFTDSLLTITATVPVYILPCSLHSVYTCIGYKGVRRQFEV